MSIKRKLQVFISSTFIDLIEERQAAVAAILKSGHIPAGMELFTAGDKSQMRTIERWIDESDVYMLILGGRYGSVESISNLSYTELEYDYAVSTGKPLFAVVITDEAQNRKVKIGGMQFVENSNPAALKLFRGKVLKNISSFFSEPKDIKLCVYESLSDLAANPNLKGWIAAAEVVDAKDLQEEVRRLREENAALQNVIQKSENASRTVEREKTSYYVELMKVLRGIEVKVPAELAPNGKEYTTSLFGITYANRDSLVTGVSNRYNVSDIQSFYYFNVLPKLQAHGLADNERVPGVQYRRSFLNKAGQAFFAKVERHTVLAQASKPSGHNESTQMEVSVAGMGCTQVLDGPENPQILQDNEVGEAAEVTQSGREPAKPQAEERSRRPR